MIYDNFFMEMDWQWIRVMIMSELISMRPFNIRTEEKKTIWFSHKYLFIVFAAKIISGVNENILFIGWLAQGWTSPELEMFPLTLKIIFSEINSVHTKIDKSDNI